MKDKKEKVNHINILNDAGRVYCYKLNKVEVLEKCPCNKCVMFNGTAQGDGVECLWAGDTNTVVHKVYDPNEEFDRLNNT